MSTMTMANQSTPDLNTLPDPRSPSPLSPGSSNGSASKPDLSSEITALSTKLINAINHQTNLDDELQSTRHDLEAARERITELETAAKQHDDMVQNGVLVRKTEKEKAENDLNETINEERKRRNSAVRGKRQMETELENLTSSLFEEANTMVAQARREREEAERKSEQLKSKLDESQILLNSHQEQLQDLKAVLQQLQSETPQLPDSAHGSTTPATPTNGVDSKRINNSDSTIQRHSTRQSTSSFLGQTPEPPLRYSHLVHPIMRTDIQAYDEFVSILKLPKSTSPPSRNHSGNFSGLNVIGLALGSNQSTVFDSTHRHSSSGSSLPNSSSQTTPNLGPTIVNSPSDPNSGNLKETKFYKRVLVEDIEPTLRLDTAPGLSWLARRTVLNSMLGGYLVVEPYNASSIYYSPAYPCALCGESRTGEDHTRKHRFRTSDSSDAQKYPLCDYCLTRIRASCDFVGFLRACKQGLWRGSGSGDVEFEGLAAWDESVRLRERMLWARLGGGVVPTSSPIATEPQPSPLKQSMDHSRSTEGPGSHSVQNSLSGLRSTRLGQPQSPVKERSRSAVPPEQGSQSPVTTPELRPLSSRPSEHSPSRPISAPSSKRPRSPLKTGTTASSQNNRPHTTEAPERALESSSEIASFDDEPSAIDGDRRPPSLPPRSQSGSTGNNASAKGNLVAALASKFQDQGSSNVEARKQSTGALSSRPSSAHGSARNSGRNTPAQIGSPERSPERRQPTSVAIPGAFE